MPTYSLQQQMALALAPKIAGGLSCCCSLYVVATIVRNRKLWETPYDRLILGICVLDTISSFSFGLSTWPIPRGTKNVVWAVGTEATCKAQAFFNQVAIGSPLYNGMLSLYYILKVRYAWKDYQIQRIEWIMHFFVWGWAFGTAFAALGLDIYGPASLWCGSGSTHDIYRWIFFYGPLWLMIIVVTTSCVIISLHVRRIEKAASKWRFSGQHSDIAARYSDPSSSITLHQGGDLKQPISLTSTDEPESITFAVVIQQDEVTPTGGGNSSTPETETQAPPIKSAVRNSSHTSSKRDSYKQTRLVATQSFLYAGAFYFNWTAVTVSRILGMVKGHSYFWLLLIAAITVPLYGLPNILVYMFPRIVEHPTCKKITSVLCSLSCCCFGKEKGPDDDFSQT